MQLIIKFLLKTLLGAFIIVILFFSFPKKVYSPFYFYISFNEETNKKQHFAAKDKETPKQLFKIEKPKKQNILTKHLVKKIIFDNYHVSENLYEKICKQNINRCEKVYFVDIFEQDKYSLWTIVIYFLKTLDNWVPYNIDSNIHLVKIIDDPAIPRRWLASHHSLTINISDIDNYKEFWDIFTHEFAHILDLWIIKATDWEKDEFFTEFGKSIFYKTDLSLQFYKISRLAENIKKSNTTDLDFVSWYWQTDPFEDFAETMNIYLNHNAYFRNIIKNNPSLIQKYKFFYKLFDGNYFWEDEKNASIVQKNPYRRPRDSTLMK